jgi:hypothetical protein
MIIAPSFGAVEPALPSCRAMRALVGVCVASAMLLAGCGGGSDKPPAPANTATPAKTGAPVEPGLTGALRAVTSGQASREFFAWTDIARVRQVAGFPEHVANLHDGPSQAKANWLTPLAVGSTSLGTSGDQVWPALQERLGFDYMQGARSISIGLPPRRAFRLDGVAAAPVAATLRRGRVRTVGDAEGHAIFARMPENKIDIDDPLGQAGILNAANRISAEGRTVAMASEDAQVTAVLGAGRTLADEPEYRAAADCLGDVVSAEIYPARLFRLASSLVAVGTRASGQTLEWVACDVGVAPGEADGLVAGLRRRLAPEAKTPDSGARIGDTARLVGADSGQAADHTWVRAVTRSPGDGPGYLLDAALINGSLGYYFGARLLPGDLANGQRAPSP